MIEGGNVGMQDTRQIDVVRLTDRPDLRDTAAEWFHEKWGVPLTAYQESMATCLQGGSAVPQWYLVLEGGRIVAGAGVIENDFHDRKDLAPNVCAVYTEKDLRGRGIAGRLLEAVCADMSRCGIDTLFLLTDHTSFMSGMAGSFSAWRRGRAKRSRPECMCITRTRLPTNDTRRPAAAGKGNAAWEAAECMKGGSWDGV